MESYARSTFSLWDVQGHIHLLYPSMLSASAWWVNWITNLNLGVIIQSPWANGASISNHWRCVTPAELWLWVLNPSATGHSLQCTFQSLEARHYVLSFRNILATLSHITFVLSPDDTSTRSPKIFPSLLQNTGYLLSTGKSPQLIFIPANTRRKGEDSLYVILSTGKFSRNFTI